MTILINSCLSKVNRRLYTHYLNGMFYSQLLEKFGKIIILAVIKSNVKKDFDTTFELSDKFSVVEISGNNALCKYLNFQNILRIYKSIKKSDYIYLTSGHLAIIIFLLNKLCKKKLFLYERGYWIDEVSIKERFGGFSVIIGWLYKCLANFLRKQMIKSSDIVFTHGKFLFEECLCIRGSNVYQVIPITLLSKNDFYYRVDTCKNDIIQLLYVGGIGSKKGLEYLIESVAHLISKGYKLKLKIVTKKNLLPHQVALIKKYDLCDYIEVFTGLTFCEILPIYREADIFILPSLSEGFPRVLYEAMSQSLPIVSSAVGSIVSVMRDGYNAILVPPGNCDAIVEAVERIIIDGSLRRQLISNAFQTVVDIYNNLTFSSHVEQVYYYATNS